MEGCIYQIRNTITEKIYIGSTFKAKARKTRHFCDLSHNRHHCIYLQRSFNKHGIDNFVFEIMETRLVENDNELRSIEELYLNNCNNLYNATKLACGGDLLSNHPNKLEIRKRIKLSHEKTMSSMTIEERAEKFGRSGEENGMFGKRHTIETRELISKINRERFANGATNPMLGKKHTDATKKKISDYAKQRIGTNNHFYGKHHTDDTKKFLSEKAKKRFNEASPEERFIRSTQIRKVIINGIMYYGVAEAARQLNVGTATICYRIKSKSVKYDQYQYDI